MRNVEHEVEDYIKFQIANALDYTLMDQLRFHFISNIKYHTEIKVDRQVRNAIGLRVRNL